MNDSEQFSLTRLERLAYAHANENAVPELIKLLRYLDTNYGQLGSIGGMPSGNLTSDQRDAHFAVRIASALASLFADPEFKLSDADFAQLIGIQQWFSIIFGASAFGNADHVIRVLNRASDDLADQITLNDRDLFKFCLLYSLDSSIPILPEALWRKSKRLAAEFFLALLSSRIVVTEPACQKREALLEWLTPRLTELSADDLPLHFIHQVWMNCSYAMRPDKHAIKRGINQLARNKLLASGVCDVPGTPPRRERPTVLCVLEWFFFGHSIYRTHSLSIQALKEKYNVVGVSLRSASDDISQRVFDKVHVIPHSEVLHSVKQVHEIAERLQPDLVYYPSIGMFPETIFLANLRLAPIQIAALGHPATTHSPVIDYVLVEEDYLGDPQCFSERVVALPAAAIPYRPPVGCPRIEPKIRKSPDPVRIAVAASLMKVNAPFLAALRHIADRSEVRVEYHFFFGAAHGLAKVYLQGVVQRFLPGCAVVYPNLPYEPYLRNINSCDMFMNPFPFGNTNGIVDTVRQGLPGVCLSGPEVHSHIDEGLFRRFGLPEWLIATTTDEYVDAAVRLAENSAEREELSRQIQKIDVEAILFKGNPRLFLSAVEWLHATHGKHGTKPPTSVLRPPSSDARPQKAGGS